MIAVGGNVSNRSGTPGGSKPVCRPRHRGQIISLLELFPPFHVPFRVPDARRINSLLLVIGPGNIEGQATLIDCMACKFWSHSG